MTNIAETLGIEPWRLLFRARRVGWALNEEDSHELSHVHGRSLHFTRWRQWSLPDGDYVEVCSTTVRPLHGPDKRNGRFQ